MKNARSTVLIIVSLYYYVASLPEQKLHVTCMPTVDICISPFSCFSPLDLHGNIRGRLFGSQKNRRTCRITYFKAGDSSLESSG